MSEDREAKIRASAAINDLLPADDVMYLLGALDGARNRAAIYHTFAQLRSAQVVHLLRDCDHASDDIG